MKKFKKLIVAAAFAVLGVGLFAQQSMTNMQTNYIFSTDVDAYMDVNNWSQVAPENAFLYFTADGAYYTFGLAKDFGSFYWGTYYRGDLYNSTKTVTTTDAGTTKTVATGDNTRFYFNNLFGFGNLGLRLDFYYSNRGSNITDDGSTKTETDNRYWYTNLTAGLSEASLGSLSLKPWAKLYYYSNYNSDSRIITTTAATETTVDTRDNRFGIAAGATADLSKSEKNEQSLTFSLGAYFTNPADKEDHKSKSTYIFLPLTYKIIFNPTEKLSFGFRTRVENSLTSSTNETEDKTLKLSLTPYLYAGLTYDTLKKVKFNTGVTFTVPSFTYTKTTTETSTTKESEFIGNDGSVVYYSGLTFEPVKDLLIDCSWNIASDLFYQNEDKLNPGNGTNFWATVNQVLIHRITFAVSYKF